VKGLLQKIFGSKPIAQLDLFSSSPPISIPNTLAPQKVERVAAEVTTAAVLIRYAPRLRKGWRLQWRTAGKPELTLPRYMSDPGFLEVRRQIQEWCILAQKRKTAALKLQMKQLETDIWKETEALLQESGKPLVSRGDRVGPIRTQGRHHNLTPHFEFVNERYFGGAITCQITWSGRIGGLSFHSSRKDPKTGQRVDLVSISKGYDHANCPDWSLRGIIYHECLHIAVPPEKRVSRRVVHGKEFRQREQQYEYYEQWKRWHAEVLARNVRAAQRESRQAKRG